MHELGIMTGVMESVESVAREGVLKVSLQVGVMTEAIEDALQFAFEALAENNDYFEGATLEVEMIQPKSICTQCGHEFTHDRFHMLCPECGSPFLQLLEGKELQISSIEVDLPDEEEDTTKPAQENESSEADQAVDSEHEKE